MGKRQLFVLVGLVVAFAAAFALRGEGDSAPVVSVAPAENGEAEAAPEEPGSYLAFREASGTDLTTEMFRRAKEQAAAIPASTGTWTDLGPTNIGGRITDLVVDASNANTIYVAAAGGGVWKSTDAGMTYTTAWPDQNVQAIGALARASNGTLWAGTGEANPPGGGLTYFGDGIYSSTDGGATWQRRGLTDSGSFGRIAIDPTNPNRLFAAAAGTVSTSVSQRGIYRSTDGGATWQQEIGRASCRERV